MAMFEMKADYFTGIEFIDKEHTKLFEIVDRAYQLLHDEFVYDKFDGVATILNELLEYTKFHFADEECYMESIGYLKIHSQRIKHAEFIGKLEAIDLTTVDQNPEAVIEELLKFLIDWLVNHILYMDKQIALAPVPKEVESA